MFFAPAQPCQVFAADWKDRFLHEAPQAWSELLQRRKVFERVQTGDMESTSGEREPFRHVSKARDIYKRNGNCFSYVSEGVRENKEYGIAWVVNGAYAFELKRTTANDKWMLNDLVVFDRGGDASRLLRYRDLQTHDVDYELLLVAQMPLPEMVKKPYFTVIGVRPLNGESEQLVEVEFEYRHPPDERVPVFLNPVLFDRGKLFLAPHRSWVLSSYEIAGGASKWGGKSRTIVRHALEGRETPILRTREEQGSWEGLGHSKQRVQLEQIEFLRPPSLEDFTLSAFGLPEPVGTIKRSTPWYIWSGIAAIVLVVLGVIVQRLAVRRT
jgi:hypothetical protein